ncbi:MAG: MATE family efflux transporter [Gammaproteobacteria bacterium]
MPTRADIEALFRLAAPLVLIQVGTMLMGVVDTMMVGRLSAAALAAAAIANVYFFAFSMFGVGVLFSLDPIVAQALGAGDELAVQRGVQRGFLLATIVAVPVSLALLTVRPALELAGQPADVVPAAAGYVYRTLASVWPFYIFIVLRQTLQAHHRTRAILVTIVASNLLNAVLNYVLIYGEFGFPAMGLNGSAWATTVSRWFMAALLLVLGWQHHGQYLRRAAPNLLDVAALGRMLLLGAPIGAQFVLESSVFGVVGLLMGWLGVTQVAAHQVVLNLASLTFMVPLGVASAAAVIVGQAVGRGDADGVRRSTIAALAVGAGFMAVMAVLLIGAPEFLARAYTNDAGVLELAVLLMPIAGVFQVFDGLQVVSIGLLRGLGDTHVPVIVNVVGFWCIGMPVSLTLGFVLGYGAVGLWWGFVVGLVIVATFLIVRVRQHEHRDFARVVIDEHRPSP